MNKEKIIGGVIIIFLILMLGLYYGWFSPAKPSVILHLAPNSTEILGFTYAKYPGTLQCIACTGFTGIIKVYYEETLICESKESLIGLGEATMPVRCDKSLSDYENKIVKVEAIGRVTPAGSKTMESYDEKTLKLEFIRK